MPFWRILAAAAALSAVAVAVMAAPKRPALPKPELVTIEFFIGGNKFIVTGTPVERFEGPQIQVADHTAKKQ